MEKFIEPSMPWVIDTLAKRLKRQFLRQKPNVSVKKLDSFLAKQFQDKYWKNEFNFNRYTALDYLDSVNANDKADKALKKLAVKDYKTRIRTRLITLFKLAV